MRYFNMRYFLLFLILTSCLFGQEEATVSDFLKIPVGTRAIGIGSAYTSVSDDIYSVFWNPAGLNKTSLYEISLYNNKHVAYFY